MKAIINARIYNTETADVVCDISQGWKGSDLDWHETGLFRTKNGTFFVAGRGGPRSMWAERQGRSCSAGSGLRVVDLDEARGHMEAVGCPEEVYAAFGLPLLEG